MQKITPYILLNPGLRQSIQQYIVNQQRDKTISPNSSIGRRYHQQDNVIVKDVKMPIVSPINEEYIVSGEASCLDNDVPSSLRVNLALNKSVIS